jgi:hypothetical protein
MRSGWGLLKVDYMGWAGSGQSIRAAPWRPKREREREMAQTAGRPGPAASLRFIFSAVEANTGLRDAPPPSPSLTTTQRRFEFDRREKDEPPYRTLLGTSPRQSVQRQGQCQSETRADCSLQLFQLNGKSDMKQSAARACAIVY